MAIVGRAALHMTTISFVGAQPYWPPEKDDGDQYCCAELSPLMVIIILVLIVVFFFMGFFSIYIHQWSNSEPYRRALAARGLNPSIIEALPTFSYSEVKDQERALLECAICLSEFDEKEMLRLLPKCNHVFHPECVVMWLKFHVTCPVCRANLNQLANDGPQRSGDVEVGIHNGPLVTHLRSSTSIPTATSSSSV